jgi:hypothetical protein
LEEVATTMATTGYQARRAELSRQAEVEATMPEEQGKGRPVFGEVGTTGLDARGGRVYAEYNRELQTLADRMSRFEEMRRSDSAMAVIEAVVSLPIRAAYCHVVPGDDKQLAERIETNLFEEMTHSWDDFLRQAILATLYGFAIFEKVFEKKADGFLGWRKFAPRDRRTVQTWNFDETGGLAGFHQRGINPATGSWEEADLPIEKLVVFTWRGESGDPEGLGAFRQAWKAFRYKESLEEFAAIRIERQACGMPIATPPMSPEMTQPDVDAMLDRLQRMRTGESDGMVKPYGWVIEPFALGAADVPFETHIERQHQAILQSVLAQFVGFAQGGDSGSFALSRDSSSIFLMSLNAVCRWLADAFNRYCVAQLVAFNEPRPGKLPRLEFGPVGIRNVNDLSKAVRELVGPNAPMPVDLEEYIREAANLPSLKPEIKAKREAEELNPPTPVVLPAEPPSAPPAEGTEEPGVASSP